MAGRQAKVITPAGIRRLLVEAGRSPVSIDDLMERLEEHPSDWPVKLFTAAPEPRAWRIASGAVQREPTPVFWLILEPADLPSGADAVRRLREGRS